MAFRTHARSTLAILWLCASSVFGQTESEPLGSISGVVLDPTGETPIRNAVVSARNKKSPRGLRTRTDPQGRFLFRDLEAGQYALGAEHRAYMHQQTQVNVAVAAGEDVSGVEIPLLPPAVISGQVLDEAGDPVISANVEAWRWGRRDGEPELLGRGNARTDDRGEFRLARLLPGRYAVSAEVSAGGGSDYEWQPALDDPEGRRLEMGYLRTYYPGVLDPSSAALVSVTTGAEVGGIVIRITPQRTLWISGRINGGPPGGSRAAQPLLRKFDRTGVDLITPTRRDHLGNFRFEGLSPGRYVLSTQVDDPVNPKIGWRVVELTDRPVAGVELDLVAGVEVHGRVVFEGDQDTSTMRPLVWLSPRDIVQTNRESTIDPSTGRFTIPTVPAWTYEVDAMGRSTDGTGDYYYLSEVRVGGIPQQSHELVVGESPPPEVEIVLARSARISGVVRDENGNPAPGAVVLVGADANDWSFRGPAAYTDQRGGFTTRGYLPGERMVYAVDRFDANADDPEELKRLLQGKGEEVEVEKAGDHHVELKLVRRE